MEFAKIENCLKQIREKTGFIPKAAVILGSGLGGFADTIKVEAEIPYSKIKGFPVSTVPGHEGKFIFGYVGDTPVAAMQGRVHYYEGYDMHDVVLPIRLLKLLGAEVLVITNAAGGMADGMKAGDLMVIRDHISSFVPSPLRGANIDEIGTRFPDMSEVYDRALSDKINEIAKSIGCDIKNGVYIQTAGPQYETPAEIKMFKALGADAVGMSTACDAIAARHAGMRVCGISCITNLAAGIAKHEFTHAEVMETTKKTEDVFCRLLTEFIGGNNF